MSSGVIISPKCITAYEELNKRMHFAIVLRTDKGNKELIVEKTFPNSSDVDPVQKWAELVNCLPENDCRFVVTDFQWKESGTVVSSKVCGIHWAPEYAPAKSKVVYATTKESLQSQIEVQKMIQATEMEELSYAAVKGAIAK